MKYGLSEKQLMEITSKLAEIPEIEEAVLFGSRAIGTYKEASDIDIALKVLCLAQKACLFTP
jgi:predicted nucleotidyltransferase